MLKILQITSFLMLPMKVTSPYKKQSEKEGYYERKKIVIYN